MEMNVAYGYNQGNETVQSNVYEIPDVAQKPKKVYSVPNQDQGRATIKTKKRDYRFNIFITFFAAVAFLLTLSFLIFFVAHYSSNQPLETQQSIDIEDLKALLNRSNEKLQFQESQLREAQLLMISLQQQLNTTAELQQTVQQQLNMSDQVIKGQASEFQGYIHLVAQQGHSILLDEIAEGWMKIADLDMTDPTQECPDGFKLINRTEPPLRTCGRPDGTTGCVSTTFSVHGTQYSRVCGRIVGYQIGSPSGFQTGSSSINSHYMAGISLTHGSQRQHIWSLVNAQGEGFPGEVCPCIQGSTVTVPAFVGNDYFCDSAIRGTSVTIGTFYPSDPLWDGHGCGSTSTCCEFNNPPWFCKQLSQPTTDDIELRLCENSTPRDDDSPFEIIELYIN